MDRDGVVELADVALSARKLQSEIQDGLDRLVLLEALADEVWSRLPTDGLGGAGQGCPRTVA